MPENYDFKSEWPKIKKKLVNLSQEAMVLAKKGEEELVKFSHKSKLHIDATAFRLKKEKLYYRIGKEYVKTGKLKEISITMKKMLEELKDIEKGESALKKEMKAEKPKKSRVKRSVKAEGGKGQEDK